MSARIHPASTVLVLDLYSEPTPQHNASRYRARHRWVATLDTPGAHPFTVHGRSPADILDTLRECFRDIKLAPSIRDLF
jgi:hypothetical protein